MWAALLTLAAAMRLAGGYVEMVSESGRHNGELRLTCRHLDAHIAVLSAAFFSDDANSTARSIRAPVVRRCSGVNHCSFNLTSDYETSQDWGDGDIRLQYACFNGDHVTKFCNADIVVEDEGFVHSPGYPKYYVGQHDCGWSLRALQGQRIQLTLLDISLRSIGPMEANCTDRLLVSEDSHVLLSTCSEEEDAFVLESDGGAINVSVVYGSRALFPKRGVLFHYKALGCPQPPTPQDGYLVHKNDTDAEYMCCVDHVFPDTLRRDRHLHCANGNKWNMSLPDCINATQGMSRDVHSDVNMTKSEVAAIVKESDFMIDVMLPTLIICVLLIGNGVIIFVIFHLRKRKLPRTEDDEERGAIYQSQDGNSCEKAINV